MNLRLLELILKFHGGQVREGNREDGKPDPQVEHLFRVMHRLLSPLPHYPESLQVVRMNVLPLVTDVALAHDLLEDTEVTPEQLAEVIHPYAMDAVVALTRPADDSLTYAEYIEQQVLPNPIASLVKLGDIEDNIEHAKESLRMRYSKAKQTIMNHWNAVVFPTADTEAVNESLGDEKPLIITDPKG